VAWGVGFASVEEIGELNILHATGLAMRRAVETLAVTPVFALVDGNYKFKLPCEIKTVVKGDAISASIAAASILAKVARDRLMVEMDTVLSRLRLRLAQGLSRPGPCAGPAQPGPLRHPPPGLGAGAPGHAGPGRAD
jgi:ribonuclease HII